MYVYIGLFLVPCPRPISPDYSLLNGRGNNVFMPGSQCSDAVASKLHMPRHPS